jgi:mono/diheme cytochrome c family protein
MRSPDPSRQELREHRDPDELRNPVPWPVLLLVAVAVASGIHEILTSGLVAGQELGDRRTPSALRAKAHASPTSGADAAANGSAIFAASCAACHQAAGTGVPGVFPPLAGSAWVKGSDTILVRILLHGVQGTITVAGTPYNGTMPPFKDKLGDAEVAAVATYIRGQWGNGGAAVTAARVAEVRSATAARTESWKGEAELKAQP